MNLVILGSGGIAHTHALALQSSKAFHLTGVCGSDRDQVDQFGAKYNLNTYYTLEDLLIDSNVHIISVCTPSGLHEKQGLSIAKAGKHLLMEKPIALTASGAKNLIQTCRKHRVFIGTFFQRRFESDVIKLKNIIDSGYLGTVFHISLQMNWYRSPEYYSFSSWRGTWMMDGGGALMNQSIHYIDMICHLLGNPLNVFARTRTCMHNIEVDDLAMAILQFENDITCTYQVTTAAYPGFETRIDVYGTNGSAVMSNEQLVSIQTISSNHSFKRNVVQVRAINSPVIDFDNHAKMYIFFAEKLSKSNEFSEEYAWELIRPNTIISAIYQSSKQNTVVNIYNA